jgi:2-dehydro-3-deoxygluconokinase
MERPIAADDGWSAGAEVVCIGEALALLPSIPDGEPDARAATLAGAEANVAAGLAAVGVPTAWVGRLGADVLGQVLHRELDRRGVDVGAVEFDRARPTGCYAKVTGRDEDGVPCSRMLYRRAGSAASAMGPAFLDLSPVRTRLERARIVHTSGITAALSEACADLMLELTARPRTALLSFDVNWREQMWPTGDPTAVRTLADRADVVLVGGDEAQRVFGTDDPVDLRRLLPRPQWLVVKDGARRALAVAGDGRVVAQPALDVDVVEPVGAGDAFAAGLLAGLVRGEPIGRCLRRGHLGAAAVLTVPGDSAAPLPADLVDRLLDASAADWARISVHAGGVTTPLATTGGRR